MKTPLHATRHDLPAKTRQKVVAMLNQHLADALDLGLQAKQAHWNVKGPSFIALHELFDKLAEEVENIVDDVAERAVALGGVAEGTLQIVAKHSRLAEYPRHAQTEEKHLNAIADALADFGAAVRKAIQTAADLGDADTSDLFTGVSRTVDKQLWFIEAHLQKR